MREVPLLIADQAARWQAIDSENSFIVRAPAGAGKTQLLIIRFLTLLSRVKKNPDEILAITFTRKAALQMRERILSILIDVEAGSFLPQNKWDETVCQLARVVLERDKKEGWDLIANPNQLTIQTIDAFCAYLVRQAPLTIGMSTQAQLVEDSTYYYLRAARNTLKEIDTDEEWSEAIELLLNHLDNVHESVEALLVDMLAKRDQWLPYLLSIESSDRAHLEEGLAHLIQDALDTIAKKFPQKLLQDLMSLLHFAAEKVDLSHRIQIFREDLNLPTEQLKDYPKWIAIAHALLTEEKKWRKTVTKKEGFPTEKDTHSKKMKADMLELLGELSDNTSLLELLNQIKKLPPLHYSDQQWSIIMAWKNILRLLTAHLKIIFDQEQVTDYLEIALNAGKILGDEQHPSEVFLALDQKIQHILVDEFQDTSSSQWCLLEKLTSGWSREDQRTLFLVGDPMQSIYRFRKAEVGLFLRAWQEGISSMTLKTVELTMNFRSQANLVHWMNQLFSHVMAFEECIATGAIKFMASTPAKSGDDLSVKWHPQFNLTAEQEAAGIVDMIKDLQLQNDKKKIAILLRSRQHIQHVLPALRRAKIGYQATEIEPLTKRPVIRDLLALTKAFLNPFDRIAWLAILRAPWCGLELSDLYQIAGTDFEISIWQRILQVETLNLSPEGRIRLQHFTGVMQDYWCRNDSASLRSNVEKIWNDLGGAFCLQDVFDENSSQVFFDLLDKMAIGGDISDLEYFENILLKRYSNALYIENKDSLQENNNLIEIMTIHKAKGLEFDHVILPSLERQTSREDAQLLLWSEYIGRQNKPFLILGPIKDAENNIDPMYEYLKQQESEKARHEMMRLFYVATTRAKQSLHLIGNVTYEEEKGIKAPSENSFLGLIWSQVEPIFLQAIENIPVVKAVASSSSSDKLLKRLKREYLKC